jgi:hypothetical protein
MKSIVSEVMSCMCRFESANNVAPNVIMLGREAFHGFTQEIVDSADRDYFCGCRVLTTHSPGIRVGRIVEPLK